MLLLFVLKEKLWEQRYRLEVEMKVRLIGIGIDKTMQQEKSNSKNWISSSSKYATITKKYIYTSEIG